VYRRFNYTGFLETGVIHFEITPGVTDKSFSYFYHNRANNKNRITLKKLSTNASATMLGSNGKYYKEFQTFVDYYGDTNYGDKWVSAARWKTNTDFSSKFVPHAYVNHQLCPTSFPKLHFLLFQQTR
jgi:hypothetical protein